MLLRRRLDKLGICVGHVLCFIVGFLGFLVAFLDFGEQVEGFLAVILEGGIFFQDAVEFYLFGLGSELGVHRLREQTGVLFHGRVDVEVVHASQRFSGLLQIVARLLEGVLGLGDVVLLFRGVVPGFDLLLDVSVGR